MTTSTKQTKPFTQIPNEVILARIPDKLKLLLCYCYSNTSSWKYNVPDAMEFLRIERRAVQKHFKMLIDAGIFTNTTAHPIKHGFIPNYLFHSEKVEEFIAKQPANLEDNPRTEPANGPANQPANGPANLDDTNNTKKQYQETKLEKQQETNNRTFSSPIESSTRRDSIFHDLNTPLVFYPERFWTWLVEFDSGVNFNALPKGARQYFLDKYLESTNSSTPSGGKSEREEL